MKILIFFLLVFYAFFPILMVKEPAAQKWI